MDNISISFEDVPDDPSALAELLAQENASRTDVSEEVTHLLRMALAIVGIYVRPGGFPSTRRVPDASAQGVRSVADGQDADVERGFLAGLLASVVDRSMPGTDPLDVAHGYSAGARELAGRMSLATGEDSWFSALQHRSAVSVALAQWPYPDNAARPNEASRLADYLLEHASQMAAQAAIVRLMLHLPADMFAGDEVPAIEHIRVALETFMAEGLAAQEIHSRLITLLPGSTAGP